MAWEAIGAGIRLAGAVHALLLLGYALLALKPRRRAGIPAAYAACLMGALLTSVLPTGPLLAAASTAWLALPAATYLLILQVADGALPERRHGCVMVIPALAAAPAAVRYGFGFSQLCAGGLCVPLDASLRLYAVISGGSVLAAALILRHSRLMSLAAATEQRPRYALLAAILAMQGVMLGLDLLSLTHAVDGPRAGTAAATVQVAMLYLVGSALFRLPAPPPEHRPGTISRPDVSTEREAVSPPSAKHPNPTPPPYDTHRDSDRHDTDRHRNAGLSNSSRHAPEPLSARERALLNEAQRIMSEDKLYREAGFSRRDLAATLNVPEHQVTRVLNVGLGQSFTNFVNSYRIADARDKLLHSNLQVTEVAFRAGFNTLATFNRVFKDGTGITPRQYRLQNQSQ